MATSFEQFKARQLVGLYRNFQAQHRQAYEQAKQAKFRRHEAARLLMQAKLERDYLLNPGQGYSPERLEQFKQETAARVEACEMYVQEVEATIAEFENKQKELQPYVRQTGKVAESIINAFDRAEQRLKDDLRNTPSGLDGAVTADILSLQAANDTAIAIANRPQQ